MLETKALVVRADVHIGQATNVELVKVAVGPTPRCIAGSRAGPPEDVGGTYGYAEFLEAWSDPLHEEHRDMRRWVGRKFDPERFDVAENNKAITRAIRRSKGSYRFRHETRSQNLGCHRPGS